MKKILTIIIIFCIAAAAGYFVFGKKDDLSVVETSHEQFEYHTLDGNGILIIMFKDSLELIADKGTTKSLKQNSLDNDLAVSVNAGYFTETQDHAGLLVLDGQKIVNHAALDKQLTHVAVLLDGEVEFISNSDFDLTSLPDNATAFQTGPLLINDNEIQRSLITNALNGGVETYRTFMGKTTEGKTFIGVTRQKYNLTQLSEKLLASEVFVNETISVLNLDGGSSVSMYAKNEEDYNYFEFKELPYLIGVKE